MRRGSDARCRSELRADPTSDWRQLRRVREGVPGRPGLLSGSACTVNCAAGQTKCGQSCVTTATDAQNCGTCGTTCATGQVCTASQCQCSGGLTSCSNQCVNTATSNTNCRACGTTCAAGQVCTGGKCECSGGPHLLLEPMRQHDDEQRQLRSLRHRVRDRNRVLRRQVRVRRDLLRHRLLHQAGECTPYASETNSLCGTAGATCAACPGGQTCSTTKGTCATTTMTGPCTWTAGPSSNSGELTCYWFGQGTSKGSSTECSTYKTACGYSRNRGGAECRTGDSAQAAPRTPYPTSPTALILPPPSTHRPLWPGEILRDVRAGLAMEGKSITATQVVDECATCNGVTGHVDLSLPAALALGLSTANGDPKSGVTWKAVDCAVTGNIVGIFNGNYAGQVYFQNVVFPVAKAVAGGATATQKGGFWDFGKAVNGQSVTLTDTLGHVVTGAIPGSSGGSVGTQFPQTCQ